ncbi:MAG: M42 family peptidase [Bacillota bacterium]
MTLLAELSELPGPSGAEFPVASAAQRWLEQRCPEVWTDQMGNVMARLPGTGSGGKHVGTVVLAAHMDEVGLVIKDVDERGFLRFALLGDMDERVLVGQEVTVYGRRTVDGIIGMKPPHLVKDEERRKSIPIDDLFIDTGLGEKAKEVVRVGDVACFKRKLLRLKSHLVAGKALDNRAGAAAVCRTMELLSQRRHPPDVVAILTVQEEEGLRGATTACFRLQPRVAIAVDVTHGDMPGLPEHDSCKLGGGPAILVGANAHPKLVDLLCAAAGSLGMKYQVEVAPGRSGTDAWAMQVSGEGVATAVVSIPLRYMHTSVETLDLRDGVWCAVLLAEAITRMDAPFMEGLTCWE